MKRVLAAGLLIVALLGFSGPVAQADTHGALIPPLTSTWE
jgi:hypothetical protein